MSSEESPEVCGSTQTGSELGVKILITCSCDEDLRAGGVADAGMHDSRSGVPPAATRALAGGLFEARTRSAPHAGWTTTTKVNTLWLQPRGNAEGNLLGSATLLWAIPQLLVFRLTGG